MKTRIFDLKVHPQDNSAVLRTGAAHPLPDFSVCVRTRRTRSNGSPVIDYRAVVRALTGRLQGFLRLDNFHYPLL